MSASSDRQRALKGSSVVLGEERMSRNGLSVPATLSPRNNDDLHFIH